MQAAAPFTFAGFRHVAGVPGSGMLWVAYSSPDGRWANIQLTSDDRPVKPWQAPGVLQYTRGDGQPGVSLYVWDAHDSLWEVYRDPDGSWHWQTV